MSRLLSRLRLLLLAAWTAAGAASAPCAGGDPPPSIRRLELPAEEIQQYPIAIPTEPGNTVELDFPDPVADWAGRGFTPDPARFAGDFVIEAVRGSPRLFVTPVVRDAHRVLHVVLRGKGGAERSVPVEFIAAPAGQAWRKVTLTTPLEASRPTGETQPGGRIALQDAPPLPSFPSVTPKLEIGLIRTLRLALALGSEGAERLAAANPALEEATFHGAPRDFGSFTLEVRYALRDSVFDALALAVRVANAGVRRLVFDPGSWVIRVGDRVYPARTVDFANEVEPGDSQWAILVLARAQDGTPTRLLAHNRFEVSVGVAAAVSPRPVRRMDADSGPSG